MARSNPPTAKQLAYLGRLGYAMVPPRSSREASVLLDALEAGRTAKEAEQVMLAARVEEARRRMPDVRAYVEGLAQMARDSEGEFSCPGFRLDALCDDPTLRPWDGAFLPLHVALRFPHLLATEGLDYEELERLPRGGRIVNDAGQIVDLTRSRSRPTQRPVSSACGCVVLLGLVAGALIIVLLALLAR